METNADEMALTSGGSQREQATLAIRGMIEKGKFSGVGYLPSIRKISDLIGQNRDAVWRALSDLEREGYVRATANRRYELHPSVRSSSLRQLDVQLVMMGEGSIRFSGLQRFHRALVETEARLNMRFHLRCVSDARAIEPAWFKGMDVAVIGGFFENSEYLSQVPAKLPRIGVMGWFDWTPDCLIHTDNHLGGRLAARRLIEAGVRRPFLAGYLRPDIEKQAALRKLGFQTEWVENERDLADVKEAWMEEGNTYQRVVELKRAVQQADDRDGYFCLDKMCAVDLLSVLQHLGIDVPGKVKVISFDGSSESLSTKPTLTHIKQDAESMAQLAAESIRMLCSGNADKVAKRTMLPPKLVVRESA